MTQTRYAPRKEQKATKLVDNYLIVECKAASKNNRVFAAQALT